MKGLILLLFPVLFFSCQEKNHSIDKRDMSTLSHDSDQAQSKLKDIKKMGPGKYAAYHTAIRTRTDKPGVGYPLNYKSEELQKATKRSKRLKSKNLEWTERGPGNVGGRTRDIIYDPRDLTYNTWIVGSAGGGVWKTEDGGKNWKHVTEELPNLSTTTVVSSKANLDVIYVGTGDGIFGGGIGGSGIYKSIDNGDSFTVVRNTADDPRFANITRMAVSADDENIIWASTTVSFDRVSGPPSSYIMNSRDGGDTWTEQFSSLERIQQIVLDPKNDSTLYASSNGNGIYKTTDSGATWDLVFNALAFDLGRMEIAVSPSNPHVVYFAAESFKARLFKSNDGGINWFEIVNLEGLLGNWMGEQGWYDNTVAVHPFDESSVFVGGAGPILNIFTDGEILTLPNFEVENETDFLINQGLLISAENKAIGITDSNLLPIEEYIEIELNFGSGVSSAYVFSNDEDDFSFTGRAPIPVTALDEDGNKYTLAIIDSNESGRWDENEESEDLAREDIIIYKIQDTAEAIVHLEEGKVFEDAMYFFSPVLQEGINPNLIFKGTVNIKQKIRNVRDSSFKPIADGYSEYFDNFPDVGSKGVHVDHHNLVMIPIDSASNSFYILNANDGGVAFSKDGGESFVQTGSTFAIDDTSLKGYNTSQFYGLDKMNGSDRYIGGTQDNGSWVSGEDPDEASSWNSAPSGDGFEAAWHYTDSNLLLESSQFNNIFKSYDGGETWSFIPLPESEGPFVTRIANSKQEPDFVCMISSVGILKSFDFGESWDPVVMPNEWFFDGFGAPVEISVASPLVVWTGSTSSTIAVSNDAASSFKNASDYPLTEQGRLTGLATHPTNSNKAYALYSKHDLPKILMTDDLGQTWTDLSGFETERKESQNGFPNVATTSLLVMPYDTTIIWAGTEIGLFESIDNGRSWHYANNGLPPVSIWEMKIVNDEVILATHGRGIWSVSIPELDGYEPIESVRLPAIGIDYTFASDVNGNFNLKSSYDSTRIFLKIPSKPRAILIETLGFNDEVSTKNFNYDFAEYVKGDVIIEASLIIESFVDGKSLSVSRTIELFEINDVVIYPYDNQLEEMESSFAKLNFTESLVGDLNTNGLQSPHPYAPNSRYIAILQDPIVIHDLRDTFSFDEIVLVEAGASEDPDSDLFWDYVQMSATNNRGKEWKRLERYDAQANALWQDYDIARVDPNLIVNRQLDLSQFNVNDTLYFRFELVTDPGAEGWGWYVDNIKYGEINTAVDDVDFDIFEMRLSPNPATDISILELSLHEKGRVSVQLFDLSGKLVMDVYDDILFKGVNIIQADISNLDAGMYLTVISSKNQKRSIKFIKQ